MPRGAPLFMYSDQSTYQHVALYLGNGMMRTTDSSKGYTYECPVSSWEPKYRVLGWREDLEGYHVIGGSDPEPDPKEDGFVDYYVSYAHDDHKIPGDGQWHTLRIDDDGGYSVGGKSGPFHFITTASMYVSGEKGSEINIRAILVDYKAGTDTVMSGDYPYVEQASNGGQTQMQYAMQGYVPKGPSGKSTRLRFEVRAYSDVTVQYFNPRTTTW